MKYVRAICAHVKQHAEGKNQTQYMKKRSVFSLKQQEKLIGPHDNKEHKCGNVDQDAGNFPYVWKQEVEKSGFKGYEVNQGSQ